MKRSHADMIALSLLIVTQSTVATAQEPPSAGGPLPPPPADYSVPTFGTPQPPPPPSLSFTEKVDQELAPRRHPRKFSFKLDGGFLYRNLYSIDIASAGLEFSIGGRIGKHRVNSVFASLQAAFGKTEGGLSTRRFGVGVLWEKGFDRLRTGAGLDICLLDVNRVTQPDSAWALGFSPRVHVGVDLAQFEGDHAIYAEARGALDIYVLNVELNRNAPIAPGFSFAFGYRF